MAKRYGKLPTEVLPKGTVSRAHELSFNVNVALLASIAEYKAYNKSKNESGAIRDRAGARAAIAEARADIYDMEQERKRRA